MGIPELPSKELSDVYKIFIETEKIDDVHLLQLLGAILDLKQKKVRIQINCTKPNQTVGDLEQGPEFRAKLPNVQVHSEMTNTLQVKTYLNVERGNTITVYYQLNNATEEVKQVEQIQTDLSVRQIGKVLFIYRAQLGPFKYDGANAEEETQRIYKPLVVLPNGDQYIGQWDQQDTVHGRGIMYRVNSYIVEGHWKNGQLIKGRKININGNYGHQLNGQANGHGAYTFGDGSKYVGEWQDDKRHGTGVCTYADGSQYVGDWQDDTRHGTGVCTWTDGSQYEGNWQDGRKNGTGVFTYADGSQYEGDWQDDTRHGTGVCTWTDGSQYQGNWQDGRRHGTGVFTYADGSQYDGDWWDGYKHGTGVFTYADGSQYEGDWEYGSRHGTGVFTYADESQYEGDWQDDKMHSTGVFTYADGSSYEGDWQDDKRHGTGVYTYADGSKYEGDWQDDRKHGNGVFTWGSEGHEYVGRLPEGQQRDDMSVYTQAPGTVKKGIWSEGNLLQLLD